MVIMYTLSKSRGWCWLFPRVPAAGRPDRVSVLRDCSGKRCGTCSVPWSSTILHRGMIRRLIDCVPDVLGRGGLTSAIRLAGSQTTVSKWKNCLSFAKSTLHVLHFPLKPPHSTPTDTHALIRTPYQHCSSYLCKNCLVMGLGGTNYGTASDS